MTNKGPGDPRGRRHQARFEEPSFKDINCWLQLGRRAERLSRWREGRAQRGAPRPSSRQAGCALRLRNGRNAVRATPSLPQRHLPADPGQQARPPRTEVAGPFPRGLTLPRTPGTPLPRSTYLKHERGRRRAQPHFSRWQDHSGSNLATPRPAWCPAAGQPLPRRPSLPLLSSRISPEFAPGPFPASPSSVPASWAPASSFLQRPLKPQRVTSCICGCLQDAFVCFFLSASQVQHAPEGILVFPENEFHLLTIFSDTVRPKLRVGGLFPTPAPPTHHIQSRSVFRVSPESLPSWPLPWVTHRLSRLGLPRRLTSCSGRPHSIARLTVPTSSSGYITALRPDLDTSPLLPDKVQALPCVKA